MRVKVCGITRTEDALAAVAAGADALGFVFYEPSPRNVTVEQAKAIVAALPPFVERVGLFVNCDAEMVNRTCKEANLSLAQIHFDASPDFYDALDVKHVKVVRARAPEDLDWYADEYRLVDAFVEEYGGQGKRIPLEWFEGRDCSRIVLAGGLNPGNVGSVLSYGFYGVDASSGLEASKGVKDHKKVEGFVRKAKGL